MLYVICEDSGAGRVFWERLFTARETIFRLYTTGGNTRMYFVLNELGDVQAGDTIFLIFDSCCIDSVLDSYNRILDFALDKGCSFKVTTYACFEEYMLSYTYLEDLVGCTEEGLLSMLSLVRDVVYCRTQEDYFNREEFVSFKEVTSSRTREALAFQLLNKITNYGGGRFRVRKGVLGNCWFTDCIQQIERKGSHECSLCPWNEKQLTALWKVENFIANSCGCVEDILEYGRSL